MDSGPVTWVLMKNGVWWPIQYSNPDDDGEAFEQLHSHIRKAIIYGIFKEVIIDVRDETTVQSVCADSAEFKIMCDQVVPVHLQAKFSDAVLGLTEKLYSPLGGSMGADSAISDSLQTQIVTKRKDVISWDDYFMVRVVR